MKEKKDDADGPGDPDVLVIRDPYLLDTSAAGAFIHGLEDEFMDVRSATIGMRALSDKF